MGSFWAEPPGEEVDTSADPSRVVALAAVNVAEGIRDADADLEQQLTVLRAWAQAHHHELVGEVCLRGTHTEISDQAAAVLASREGEFEILAVARLHHVVADQDDWQFLATAAEWSGQHIVHVDSIEGPGAQVTADRLPQLQQCQGLSKWDRHE